MDDLDFEARLRARLHRRFDGAEPPVSLRPVLAAVPMRTVRTLPRSVSIAWLAVAILIVVVAAGVGLRYGTGPGASPTPTPTPVSSATDDYGRQYIVMSSRSSVPSKASTGLAIDALNLRIHAIGIGNFSSAAGYAITFQLPGNVDDALVRSVLGATGDLSFVPLPPADYGSSARVAVIGQALPVSEPELFTRDRIVSSGVSTSSGQPASVHVSLDAVGTAALEVYTSGHVGETLAVLVDGAVAALPVIQAPIANGELEISAAPGELAFLAAIFDSGPLPEEWRAPRVPVLISESQARDAALAAAASPDATVVSAELSTYDGPGGLIAAWIVDLSGTLPDASCTSSPLQSPVPPPCPAVSSGQVILDATTGDILESTF